MRKCYPPEVHKAMEEDKWIEWIALFLIVLSAIIGIFISNV